MYVIPSQLLSCIVYIALHLVFHLMMWLDDNGIPVLGECPFLWSHNIPPCRSTIIYSRMDEWVVSHFLLLQWRRLAQIIFNVQYNICRIRSWSGQSFVSWNIGWNSPMYPPWRVHWFTPPQHRGMLMSPPPCQHSESLDFWSLKNSSKFFHSLWMGLSIFSFIFLINKN